MSGEYVRVGGGNKIKVGEGSAKGAVQYLRREGRYADVGDRLVHAEEGNLPAWADRAAEYFEAADKHMVRGLGTDRPGTKALTAEIALPVELDAEEMIEVVRGFMSDLLGDERLPYAWAIHEGNGTNPHLHYVLSESIDDGVERPVHLWFRNKARGDKPANEGGAPKTRRLNDRRMPDMVRQTLQRHVNDALEAAGSDARFDMRSYERRGVELERQVKVGRTVEGAAGDEGRRSVVARALHNLHVVERNAKRIEDHPERLLALFRHQRTIGTDQLDREIRSRCRLDDDQPARVRGAVHALLTPVGADGRGVMRLATREQLCDAPELAVQALTQTRTSFTESDLIRLFGTDARGSRALARVLRHPDLVCAGAHPVPGGVGDAPLVEERFTSAELLAAEKRLYDEADALRAQRGPAFARASVEQVAAEFDLDRGRPDGEQRRLLEAAAGLDPSHGRVVLVQGLPGVGKSYVVEALADVAGRHGVAVIGAATAGSAARALGQSAGIDTFTLAKLGKDLERGKRDLKGAILVVDEAGMADVKTLGRVLALARAAEVERVVLLGDVRQLAPVGPGAAFDRLQRRHGAVRLEDIQRQKVDWQRQASVTMATGTAAGIAEGLRHYRDHGGLKLHATPAEAHRALVDSYMADLEAHRSGRKRLVVAQRNADVDAINALVRQRLRAEGKLGPDQAYRGKDGRVRHFAVGDDVHFTQPNPKLGVVNGSQGRVVRVQASKVHLAMDAGSTLALDPFTHIHALAHRYAVTVHKAQGATVDRTWIYATPGQDAHGAFTALTRHEQGLELHYDLETFAPVRFGVSTPQGVREAQAYEGLVDAFVRPGDEPTATEWVERGQHGRPTDVQRHLNRLRGAKTEEDRARVADELRVMAAAKPDRVQALRAHPAVQLAQAQAIDAERGAERARQRLASVEMGPPRSLRFGAQLAYDRRRRPFLDKVREAERESKTALKALHLVLRHDDVQRAADAAMDRQRQRVAQAKQALEQLERVAAKVDDRERARDYATERNLHLGQARYRTPTPSDRLPRRLYDLVQRVRVEQTDLAILQSPSGERLVHPVTDHKSNEWLKPGDRVSFSEDGPWLHNARTQWAGEHIERELRSRNLDPAKVPALAHDELQRFTVESLAQPAADVRVAVLQDAQGRRRTVDLTYHPEGHRIAEGDGVAQPPPFDPDKDAAPARASGKAAPQDGPAKDDRPPKTRPIRVVRPRAVDAEQLAPLQQRLREVEQRLDGLKGVDTPHRVAVLQQIPAAKPALEAVLRARREVVGAQRELYAGVPRNREGAAGRLEAAKRSFKEARAELIAVGNQPEIKMELDSRLAEAGLDHERAQRATEQADIEKKALLRELTARTHAVSLKGEGVDARLAGEPDHGQAFVLDEVKKTGGREAAYLLSPDGSVVVMDVTGHDLAKGRLQQGCWVRLDRSGRKLYRPGLSFVEEAEGRVRELQTKLEQPAWTLQDALAATEKPPGPAAAYVAARDRVRAHEAAAQPPRHSDRKAALEAQTEAFARLGGALKTAAGAQWRKEAEQAARAHEAELRQARRDLRRAQAQASVHDRHADLIRARHALSRVDVAKGLGPAVVLEIGDEGFELEHFGKVGRTTVAVLRDDGGRHAVVDATYAGELRQVAHRGMPLELTEDGNSRPVLQPTRSEDRQLLEQTGMQRERSRERARQRGRGR